MLLLAADYRRYDTRITIIKNNYTKSRLSSKQNKSCRVLNKHLTTVVATSYTKWNVKTCKSDAEQTFSSRESLCFLFLMFVNAACPKECLQDNRLKLNLKLFSRHMLHHCIYICVLGVTFISANLWTWPRFKLFI